MEPAHRNCQSCGMPLKKDPEGGGTQADGSKSRPYRFESSRCADSIGAALRGVAGAVRFGSVPTRPVASAKRHPATRSRGDRVCG